MVFRTHVTRLVGAVAGASMLLLSGQAAFADDEEGEDESTESTKTTETCVEVEGGSPEPSPEPTETEAAADDETLAVVSDKPDNGNGKSAEKSNNGNGKDKSADKSNKGQANKEDKANNGGGKEAAQAKKCAKEAERAARAELKVAIKESGGSWGAEMSRAAHIKVAIKFAAKAEMLPDDAKAHALARIMALIGVNLDEDFDFASLFPEDFDIEAALAYIDEIAALGAEDEAEGSDDDDHDHDGDDDVEPSPSPIA